jgi:hypothetical protein
MPHRISIEPPIKPKSKNKKIKLPNGHIFEENFFAESMRWFIIYLVMICTLGVVTYSIKKS